MKEKAKIVFLIDTLQTGGAEKSLFEITSGFLRFTPIFIQIFKGDSLLEKFKERNIEVIQLNFNPSYRFHTIAKAIIPTIRKINPSIIHSTLFRADMIARIISRKLSIPLINSFVNNSYSPYRYKSLSVEGKFKLKCIELWDRITAKNVDLFVSNSKTIKESNAKALNINEEKITVIYRGRNKNAYKVNKANRIKKSQDLGIKDNIVLLNVSRLLERKGQLDLILAFDSLKDEFSNLVLLIAGEGHFRQVLQNKIEHLKLENRIKLLGNRVDIPELLSVSDIFIFPSYYEGLPGALIEAMLAEKIIIASDIPENKECVNENEAIFFKTGDIKDMESKIRETLNFDSSLYKIAKKANSSAVDKFDIQAIAKKYEATYYKLIQNFNS